MQFWIYCLGTDPDWIAKTLRGILQTDAFTRWCWWCHQRHDAFKCTFPSIERRDTLAFIYANDGQHLQALNTIGIEKVASDSDLAVQVKGISLKALNQPKRALEQFEVLNARTPNPYLAYELADLKIQTGDNAGAVTNIEYVIANSKADMKYAFYERQQPYEADLKAAFLHLKALVQYNMDKENVDAAVALIDQALAIDPNFNLASLSKQALEARKNPPAAVEKKD